MRLKKSFDLALNILVHSKLRSWLTIIGIIIGIAAVVSIISVSEGAQRSIESQFSTFGADILTVSAGAPRATGAQGSFGPRDGGFGGNTGTATTGVTKNITIKDVLVIKSIPNVKFVLGTVSGRESVKYETKTADVSIRGVDTSVWKDISGLETSQGRLLTIADTYSAVVGSRVATSIFGGMELNRKITVNGKIFSIVGILKETGSDDNTIYIPIQAARDGAISDVGQDDLDSISVKVSDVNLMNQTATDIQNKLMLSRGILSQRDIDFRVSSPVAFQQRISTALNTLSLFLTAIAIISLIVGAIGISNTMFTAVLEKTRDIGIMKAIGAKNMDILMIFLLNSGMIGLVGGIGGVVLGISSAGLISTYADISIGRTTLGMAYVNPWLIVGAFLLSTAIGMIAGAIPAYRASKLNPVEALRYE
jgi:putative ABC transport system permease protein